MSVLKSPLYYNGLFMPSMPVSDFIMGLPSQIPHIFCHFTKIRIADYTICGYSSSDSNYRPSSNSRRCCGSRSHCNCNYRSRCISHSTCCCIYRTIFDHIVQCFFHRNFFVDFFSHSQLHRQQQIVQLPLHQF